MTDEYQTDDEIFNKLQLLFAEIEEIILGHFTTTEKIKDVLYFAKLMVQLEGSKNFKLQPTKKTREKIKPFLFWAGSKFHEIDDIKKRLPPGKRLLEPFVGSGSVFLNTDYDSYLLADLDQDLINIFQVLAEYQQEFIEAAKQFFLQNPCDRKILRYYSHLIENKTPEKAIKDNRIKRACMFLYVNRNSVQYISSYKKNELYFPYDELNACLDKINSCNVEFLALDYQETLALAKAGDVIFCDPPTIAVTTKKYFFNIGKISFAHSDYIKQAVRGAELKHKGIPFIVPHGLLTSLIENCK